MGKKVIACFSCTHCCICIWLTSSQALVSALSLRMLGVLSWINHYQGHHTPNPVTSLPSSFYLFEQVTYLTLPPFFTYSWISTVLIILGLFADVCGAGLLGCLLHLSQRCHCWDFQWGLQSMNHSRVSDPNLHRDLWFMNLNTQLTSPPECLRDISGFSKWLTEMLSFL